MQKEKNKMSFLIAVYVNEGIIQRRSNVMKVKNKIIASAVAVMMLTSAAPMTVSAASKAKSPSRLFVK